MLFYEFSSFVKKKFGSKLSTGNIYTLNGEEIYNIYIWGALLSKKLPIVPNESLLITVIKTNKWHRALMLAPPLNAPNDALQPIEITQQDDTVAQCLQSIRLLNSPKQNAHELNLKIAFANEACNGELQVTNSKSNDVIFATLSIINLLKDQYNNASINDYLNEQDIL